MATFPNFQGFKSTVPGIDATSIPAALMELQLEKQRKNITVTTVSDVLTAGLPDNPPTIGSVVYVLNEQRNYELMALPASNLANWRPVGDGDVEDSYRASAGVFDPTIAGQHIATNQVIAAATIPVSKVYKFYFDADCSITFDIAIIGQSPMLSPDKKTWSFYAGDEFTFFKTADGLAIDGEVN